MTVASVPIPKLTSVTRIIGIINTGFITTGKPNMIGSEILNSDGINPSFAICL